MAYHNEDDIERELAQNVPFSVDTTPTALQVADIIEETEAEIDSRLSKKYTVPITGTKALIYMRKIATLISSGEVEKIQGFTYEKAADPETKQTAPARLIRGKRKLSELVRGTSTLIFETTAESAVLKRSAQKVVSSFDTDGITHSEKVTDFGVKLDTDTY